MEQDEIAGWMWGLHVAFIEVGGNSLPQDDVDFWMIWLGSIGIEDPLAVLRAL